MRFVPSEALQPGMVVARDIWGPTPAAILKKGIELTPKSIRFLNEKGYLGVYISDHLSEDVDIEEIVDQQLVRDGLMAVEQKNIGQIMNVAMELVANIFESEKVSVDLFDLRSYDDYTYHHSVNVGVYCAAVGRKMGLPQEEVVLLSLAAICHDLGKRDIDEAIIKKSGKLTDAEFEEVKKHPQYSSEILRSDPSIPLSVIQGVLMHHENENGSGYPYGKKGDEIPMFAKIIHVLDVYDALTSKRPYKNPFAPSDAFEYIQNNRGQLFDRDVVEAMIEVVPAYPPGIDVTLSNGEKALVMAHTFNAMRPKVKILESKIVVDLSIDQEYKDIEIVASGIMPQDYAGDIEELNERRAAVKERRYQILIVDDDKLSRCVARDVLWGQGYDIDDVDDGLKAIDYLKTKTIPDLVIMDIVMPIIDGVKTAHRLREIKEDIPIIFLTGSADVETVKKCKNAGALDYILKPAKPDYMKERVRAAFRKMEEAARRGKYLNETVEEQQLTQME